MSVTSFKPYYFKCILVGDKSTGKSTFIERHITGNLIKTHVSTKRLQLCMLKFFTNFGKVNFQMWDTSGIEKYPGLAKGYYFFAECAIIMYDLNSDETFCNVEHWLSDIRSIRGNIPIVVCGNKLDTAHTNLDQKRALCYGSELHLKHYVISTKLNYNIELPFMWLCQKVLHNPTVRFVKQPAPTPPLVLIDDIQYEELNDEMELLKCLPLPDESEIL